MSFRKRNVGIVSGNSRDSILPSSLKAPISQLPGVRPSPIDGRPTTSTGTTTLDGLLAGHAGLALGSSLLVEECGTTDYAGALLRFYAAEGVVQGHNVHVLGLPEQWGRELPGLVGTRDAELKGTESTEKMKIAWRYEALGQFGAGVQSRERGPTSPSEGQVSGAATSPQAFCHTFDLSKRLAHPPNTTMNFYRLDHAPHKSPFSTLLHDIKSHLVSSKSDSVHRLVIPALLSPAIYPPHASFPQHVLQFFHSLRALLSTHQAHVTAMITLPLSLYPRSSGLVRWIELLSDGVFELSPFPHSSEVDVAPQWGPSGISEEPLQGLLTIHRLPILHDRGSGTNGAGEDWGFALSRRKFSIKPFSLPPIDGDTEAQKKSSGEQKGKKSEIEF